jgi:hypothetical protein
MNRVWSIVQQLDNPQARTDTRPPVVHNPTPSNPQPAHRGMSRSCAFDRSSRPVIPSGWNHLGVARAVLYVSACPAARWTVGNAASNPTFRKEDGGSGQKARAGRQPDPRPANPGKGKTPWASREGFFAVKVEGGGDVKAFPRCLEGEPGGAGSPRGERTSRSLNRSGRHRTRGGEQRPGGEGAFAGHRRVRPTPGGHESAGETRYGSARGTNP